MQYRWKSPKKHKFNAKRTQYKAIQFGTRTYDSKAEMAYAAELDVRIRGGDVLWWLPQLPFRLPGGGKYVADFLVCDKDGVVEFIDVKGYDTPESKRKRNEVLDLYGVEIRVVQA